MAFFVPLLKGVAKAAITKAATKAATKAPQQSSQVGGDVNVYNLPDSKLKNMVTQMDDQQYQQFIQNAPADFRASHPELPFT